MGFEWLTWLGRTLMAGEDPRKGTPGPPEYRYLRSSKSKGTGATGTKEGAR